MRSIWSGSLVFGLVNVPVKVYAATEDNDIRFHQLHAEDGGRIRYQRRCELCEKTVQFSDIAKGYESDDGQTVIVTDEDLKTLPTSSDREISLLSFVPEGQIDPVLFDKSYYLEPASKSPKAYVLLREVLSHAERVAVVHFALRQKTRLAVLRVSGDVLLVQTLLWPDEVREVSFPILEQPVSVAKAEKDMATMLVDTYSADFHPEEHQDTYRVELQQLIDAKLSGGEAFSTPDEDEGQDAEVLDLLAALQRSVDAHRAESDKSESDKSETGTTADPAKKPARKPAAKKPAVGAAGGTDDGKTPAKAPAAKSPAAKSTAGKAPAAKTARAAAPKKPRAASGNTSGRGKSGGSADEQKPRTA
ncbi:Ku protein [Nakamurella silvestris]|nr:Ku protein [Nakamurella silvestris]